MNHKLDIKEGIELFEEKCTFARDEVRVWV